MKKLLLVLLAIASMAYHSKLDIEFDDGSLIEFSELTLKDIKNLELLGRVWGFLKYHYPEIAKGNYNWDYELFRFLPKYIETQSDDDRDNLIIHWINSLGKIKKCKKCKPTYKNAFLKPDLHWIDNQADKLKNTLQYVYNNRSQGKHYFIGIYRNVRNPEF